MLYALWCYCVVVWMLYAILWVRMEYAQMEGNGDWYFRWDRVLWGLAMPLFVPLYLIVALVLLVLWKLGVLR